MSTSISTSGPRLRVITFLGTRQIGLFGRQVIAPDELPDQAVIERELIDPVAPHPVDPRIADVGDQRPCGQAAASAEQVVPIP